MNVLQAKDVSSALKVCADLLVSESESIQMSTSNLKLSSTPKLIHLARSIDQLFKTYKTHSYVDLKKVSTDYRVFVKEEETTPLQYKPKRVLHYWAFSGGIAMEELKAIGVRSIIMTSGQFPRRRGKLINVF